MAQLTMHAFALVSRNSWREAALQGAGDAGQKVPSASVPFSHGAFSVLAASASVFSTAPEFAVSELSHTAPAAQQLDAGCPWNHTGANPTPAWSYTTSSCWNAPNPTTAPAVAVAPLALNDFSTHVPHRAPMFAAPVRTSASANKNSLFAYSRSQKYVQLDLLATTLAETHAYARATGSGSAITEGQLLVGCCSAIFWNEHAEHVAGVSFTGQLMRLDGVFDSGATSFASSYPNSTDLQAIASSLIACVLESEHILLCVHATGIAVASVVSPAVYSVSRFDILSGETMSTADVQLLPSDFGDIVGAGWSGIAGKEILLFTSHGSTVVCNAATTQYAGLTIPADAPITAFRAVYGEMPADCGDNTCGGDNGVVYFLVENLDASQLEWRPYKIASQVSTVVNTDLPAAAELDRLHAGAGYRGIGLIANKHVKLTDTQLVVPLEVEPAVAVDGAASSHGGTPYYDVNVSSVSIRPSRITVTGGSGVVVYGDSGDGVWLFLGTDRQQFPQSATNGVLRGDKWLQRLRFVIRATPDELAEKMRVTITMHLVLVMVIQHVSFATSFDATYLSVVPKTLYLSSSASSAASTQTVTATQDDVATGTFVETVRHAKYGATSGPIRTQFVGFQAVARYDDEIMDIYIETPLNTAVIEGADPKEYSMRLSRKPEADLTIKVTVERTPLWDKDDKASYTSQLDINNPEKGEIFSELASFTFTPDDYYIPKVVRYRAKDDDEPEQYFENNKLQGSKVQSFPQIAPRASRLAGPVTVNGYEDGSVDTAIPDPLMLRHENEEGEFLSNLEVLRELQDVLEDKQVDTLTLYDTGSATGEMQQRAITDQLGNPLNILQGLRMGKDSVIAGAHVKGGITYGNIEEVNVLLGHSGYTVDVHGTHPKSTVYRMGAGNDIVNVHTTSGPVFVYGDPVSSAGVPGGDDRLNVVPGSGDFNRVHGLVAFDGSGGIDRVAIDNSRSSATAPGHTQVGVLAHDHVSGFGWNPSEDGTYSINLCTFDFGSYAEGRYTLQIDFKGKAHYWSLSTGMSDTEITLTVQKTLFPFQTCGSKGRSVCASSVAARRVGCTLILEFRGELGGNNTFAATPLRNAAAFSIYNSIYTPHNIDLTVPPKGRGDVREWVTNKHPTTDYDYVSMDTDLNNPTPGSLQFWGNGSVTQGDVAGTTLITICFADCAKDTKPGRDRDVCQDGCCTDDHEGYDAAVHKGARRVARWVAPDGCLPWGTVTVKPSAQKANVLRATFSIKRVQPKGTCLITIDGKHSPDPSKSHPYTYPTDAAKMYFHYQTSSSADHFSGVRFVAVPLGRADRNVDFHVVGHCLVEIHLLTAERIESAMPGLYPTVPNYNIPFPEGGSCQAVDKPNPSTEPDNMAICEQPQGCDSSGTNSLANATIGDLLPVGAWSWQWEGVFNPYRKFTVSTISGSQKELHIHPEHDTTGALVFKMSGDDTDMRKYDGMRIAYNIVPNDMMAEVCSEKTKTSQEKKLAEKIYDDILRGPADNRVSVMMTDRRGAYKSAKDVAHPAPHLVDIANRTYQAVPSHRNVEIVFPLRSDTDVVRIALQPSDKKLVVYNIEFFSKGKFIDFSPIECPQSKVVFDATPSLMASLEPVGAWRYESNAADAPAGDYRDQVFQCSDTKVDGIDRSSLSFSGWRDISGKMVLDVSHFGKNYNRLELGYQNKYEPASFSYCQLSVSVVDKNDRVFKVLNQQPSDKTSGHQVLFVDLHSESKEVQFIEEGDCVFFIDYVRMREVDTNVVFTGSTDKGVKKRVVPKENPRLDQLGVSTARMRNFFRVSVDPIACEHTVEMRKINPGGSISAGSSLLFALKKDTGAVAGTIPWAMGDAIEVTFTDTQVYDFRCELTMVTEAFPITLAGIDAYDACLGPVHHTQPDGFSPQSDVNKALAGLKPSHSWSSAAREMVFNCDRHTFDSFVLTVDPPSPAQENSSLRLDTRTSNSTSLRGLKLRAEASGDCYVHGSLTTAFGGDPDPCLTAISNGTNGESTIYHIECSLHAYNGLSAETAKYSSFDLMYGIREGTAVEPCTIAVHSLELDYGYPVEKLAISNFTPDSATSADAMYANLADYTSGSTPNTNLRSNGLQYAGVEVLSVDLADYHNVLNVHGTSAKTQVTFQNGNDVVVLSSAAGTLADAEALSYKTSFPDGTLEYIQKNLLLNLGLGHHRIEMSDVASGKDRFVSLSAREIAYAAPGLVSFITTGDMGNGIFMWLSDEGACLVGSFLVYGSLHSFVLALWVLPCVCLRLQLVHF